MPERKNINNELLFASIVEILGEGVTATIRIKGSSMRPFVRNGIDTATLSPLSGEVRLRKGMVLLFRYEGGYFIHRLRGIADGMLIMKGDGNYRISERIGHSAVIAWASSVERNGREIKYGSLQWHLLSLYSLAVKTLRTMLMDFRPRRR